MAVSIKLPYKVKLSAGSGPCTHYIPVSYTSGARPYSATWFTSDTEDYESMPYHQVITPSSDYIYVVMEPGKDDTENGYYWNGNRYVTVGAESAEKTALTPPTVSSQTLYYDKDNIQYLTNYLTGFDSDTMVLSGIISTEEGNGIRNAGTYTAYVSLKDPTTNVWDLGDDNYTDADQMLSWIVNKKVVTLPVISGDSNMTYNGNPQGPNFVKGADAGYFSLRNGSAETGTDAGSYVTKYVLLNYDNMVWATAASGIENDESGNPSIYGLSWSIDKAVINVPSINGVNSFDYNGSVQGPTFNNWDSGNTQLDVGNVTATNAGSYTATFDIKDALKPNYEWVGGGNGTVSLGWSIEKIQGSFSLSETEITLDDDTVSKTVTVTVIGDGTLSIVNGDSSSIQATLSDNVITIVPIEDRVSDEVTITVKLGDGTNYLGAADQTISVSYGSWSDISWTSSSDEDIVRAVAAADAGLIDLYDDCGWRVGDERQVQLSAMAATDVSESHVTQTVTMVLVNRGGKTLANGNTCQFVVHLKNSLVETGYMNSSGTNYGGWDNCARRTWCNSVFKDAIPSTLREIFKQHKNYATRGSKSTSLINSTDWFALPAGIEVGANTSSTYSTEGTQWSYYTNSMSRIKKLGDSGSANGWWLRSPHLENGAGFRGVGNDGNGYFYNATTTLGIAPFGCI